MNNTIKQITTLIALCATSALAAPILNQVTNGTATITQNAGGGVDNTTINQTTNNATIDWHSFNIATTETVTFNQPNTQSLTINNILDANPSQILGNITANGRIVLLNPNGFYFGTNSSVSAHTFIAAAVSSSNATYNNSTNLLTILDYSSMGDITTLGTINAHTTQLIAHTINTPQGSTINTPTAGYISIRAKKDITIGGTINSPQGTIDIFALNGVATATPTATISTKNDNYDHSLAPGFIEFSGKQFVFEDHSWPFKQNSYDTLLLDPNTINIVGPTTCPTDTMCATLPNNFTVAADAAIATSNILAADLTMASSNISLSAVNRINVNAAVTITSAANLSLTTTCTTTTATCTAGGIYINRNISLSGGGDLTITSMGGLVSIGVATSATADTVITGNDITITAGTAINLTSDVSRNSAITATGNGTITLDAGTNITSDNFANTLAVATGGISLTAGTNGSIGTSGIPITIDRSSGNWVGTGPADDLTLTLSAGNDIYLRTDDAGAHTAIPSSLGSNTFSLNQTAGNIANIPFTNYQAATIILSASDPDDTTDGNGRINGNISFGPGNLIASSLTLSATGTFTSSIATARLVANTLTLNITGAIGTNNIPVRIARIFGGAWPAGSLTLNAGGNIYLRSDNADAHLAIPTNLGSNTFFLDQSLGSIAINSPHQPSRRNHRAYYF